MVNRKCDFCSNSYRKRPDVGFFSVSPAIMQHLGLAEGSSKDFICSEHFTSDCLDNAGRLIAGSIPTFFPQKLCLDHDHDYTPYETAPDSEDEGTYLFYHKQIPPKI